MSGSQRYERIATSDENDHVEGSYQHQQTIPDSPPPSFRSRSSSPASQRFLNENDPLTTDADRTLADAFDSPSDDEGSDDEHEGEASDRRRLIGAPSAEQGAAARSGEQPAPPPIERRVTQLPVFAPRSGRTYGGGNANDGVFANLSAKPTRGEQEDEKPPSYEQAAADATPPYWETTILAPGMVSDEVYVDGLPVGSIFSFVWNAMISMSFQIVGFLLTYLLHTTHAAKNGSRAGLGITLVQYGFSMKGTAALHGGGGVVDPTAQQDFASSPTDPNSHDFDPSIATGGAGPADGGAGGPAGISTTDWFAYILMIVGWFILIRSVSDFLRARRHEQLVLQSPDRGLSVPVVAEGERPESSV